MSSAYGGVAYTANVEVELGAVEYCPVSKSESMKVGSSSASSCGVSWSGNCVSCLSAGAQSRSTLELPEISSLLNPFATWGAMGLSMPGVPWNDVIMFVMMDWVSGSEMVIVVSDL